MTTRITTLVSWLLTLGAISISYAQGDVPTVKRYVCSDESSSVLVDYDHDMPSSADAWLGECNTRAGVYLDNSEGYPDFPNGTPFINNGYSITRINRGHDFQLNLTWTPGWTGTVVVTVRYQKRKPDKDDLFQKCENDGPLTDLVHYEITRGPLEVDGQLEGPTVLSSVDGSASLELSYTPSEAYGSQLDQMLFYASHNGGGLVFLELSDQVNGTFTLSEPITEFGEHFITTKIFNNCGEEIAGPTKLVSVRPSCYNDDPITYDVQGPNVRAYPEGFQVEANQVYTLTPQGSADFNTHFTLEDDGGDEFNLYQENGVWKFTVSEEFGSYRVMAKADAAQATYCTVPDPVSIFVGGRDVTIEQTCPMVLPQDLDVAFGYRPESDPDSLILKHFAATVRSQVQVVVQPGIVLESGAELILEYTPLEEVPPTDDRHNFVTTTRYNDYGEVIAEGRVYLDGSGHAHQRQAKNLAQGVTLATATLYDAYGRPTVQTLPAPISALPQAEEESETADDCPRPPYPDQALTFGYSDGWLSNPSNKPITQLRPLGDQGRDPLKLGTPEGSLGWYYSDQNGTTTSPNVRRMQETGVPITGTPYTRVQYRDDGEVMRVSQPGDEYRLGGQHTGERAKAPVADNDAHLTAYFALRSELSLPAVGNFAGNFFTRTAEGVDGKRSQAYYNREGELLISLYYGEQATPITTSYSFYDQVGRLVTLVSPRGVQQYASGTAFSAIEKTRYFYNAKGQLAAIEEPETGRTEYLYRRDGQVRFSQNSVQRAEGAFSYTHYDQLSRPVESGEYRSGPAFGSSTLMGILENTQPAGGLSGGQRYDWQRTYYDVGESDLPGDRTPAFVRGRVAYQEFGGGDAASPTVTTHYSYDERGRLRWALKQIVGLGTKTIDYTYAPDGNLRSVAYQQDDTGEAFFHYYSYNANSRLQQVYTGKKAPRYNARQEITNLSDFTLQGSYDYYLHGPRKRVVLGKHRQGLDYTYTAQGWLKGINQADPTTDPGRDGEDNSVRPDLFGTTLHYFNDDFQGTGLQAPNVLLPNSPDQYNGNLKATSWHNANEPGTTRSYAYRYDEQNQLTLANFGHLESKSEDVTTHRVRLEGYDAQGNIGQLIRKGAVAQTLANYTYHYQANQLDKITKGNQTLMDFGHNSLGQLEERTEDGTTVYYTYDAYRRLRGIYANEARTTPLATFTYDEAGNRLSKTAYDGSGQATFTTWYVHGPDGRLMSLYADNEQDATPAAVVEVPLYGAGRLGQYRPLDKTYYHEVQDHLGSVRAVIGGNKTTPFLATAELARQTDEEDHFSSIKRVTVAEHLNHTPASVVANPNQAIRINNDQDGEKQPVGASLMRPVFPGDTLSAEVFTKYEYFAPPGGPALTVLSSYLATAFGLPVAGEGAFLQAADAPLSALLAAGVAGGPTDLPQAGLGFLLFDNELKLINQGFASLTTQARIPQDAGALTNHPFERLALDEIIVEKTGFVYFFVASYDTKNVSVFFDDFAVVHRTTDVVYAADYYPHGEVMDGRLLQQTGYRYGYQGAFAEKDSETGFSGFELRQYDSRIGRWTTPDPYGQYWSPYLGMGNAPNMMIDPDGGFAGGGGPSLWTSVKAFFSGGNISNSGRFIFNSGRTFNWAAVGRQALKTTATLATSNAWRLNGRDLSNNYSSHSGFKLSYNGEQGRPDLGYVGNSIRDRAGSDFSKDLFERYWLGKGDAKLSQEQFLEIWQEIYEVDPKVFSERGRKITMEDGSTVYAKTVNFYGSDEYALALGRATLFFDVNDLPVGFYDLYDFDPKDWGIRKNDAEIKTRMVNAAGTLYGATPFKLIHGVVPSRYLK